ncbi:hypothetical protein C0J52_12557 [Blattella germanica]|nr:hypothetical protein C0J52_12557 [Blattella germanica]
MKKFNKAKWKPVELPGNVISNGIEGLIGIEELTDYSIVKGYVCNEETNVKKTQKQTQEKLNQGDGDVIVTKRKRVVKDAGTEHEGVIEPLLKKRKVNKKKKKKKSNKGSGNFEEVAIAKNEEENDFSGLMEEMNAWNEWGIPNPILRALAELGFKDPTEIQARTLSAAILGKRDILGAAETGSGKTLAFGIPILYHIFEDKRRNINEEKDLMDESRLRALILTPTRELAIQIKNHLKAVMKYTDIKIAVVVGGMSVQKQERLLSRRPEIVVATPGRLWELIGDGNPHLAGIRDIRYLAVDETDRMLEKGHFQELQNLLELLNLDEKKKRKRQNFVFSATLTLTHEPPKHLKGQKKKMKITPGQKLQSIMTVLGVTNPKVVDVTNDSGLAGTLTESRIMCSLEEKDFYLYYFLQRHRGRTLIFCNSISCVRRLAQLLSLLKCQPLPLHANMMQRQRLKNLDRFRENPFGVLLATDVAARGLDIPDSYVHRSGRTARAQKQGLTLLLIEPAEVQYYVKLCSTLGKSQELPLFPIENNALNVVKKRVALAREVDRLELASRRSTSETGWFRKALTEMDMLVDEDDLYPLKFKFKN